MRWVILNPKSNAHRARKKWVEIEPHINYDKKIDLSDLATYVHEVKENDQIISVGGDGCFHSIVNQIISLRGLDFLKALEFGVIATGSNNSLVQPTEGKFKVLNAVVQTKPPSHWQDLLEIRIDTENIKYACVNASMGLLAQANLVFNRNSFVQIIKKVSVDFADVFSFLICLIQFKSLHCKRNDSPEIITNYHWLIQPYFTKDLYFEKTAPPGQIDFYTLGRLSKWDLISRFLRMLILKKMESGFTSHTNLTKLNISSDEKVPIEIDGEVYFGQKFEFQFLASSLRRLQ